MSAAARTHWLLALLFLLALLLIGAERLPGTPASLRVLGFETVLLLAGVSLLLGVVNVLALHLRRIVLGQQDWPLSLLLIAVLIAVAGAGLLTPAGAASPLLEWVFDALIAPGQRALFALLVFFMAAAAFQFLRIGQRGGLWMLAGFLLLLLVQTPLPLWLLSQKQLPAAASFLDPLTNAARWLLDVPAMAALRGVLLGGSLAWIVIGARLLLGKP
jgi:hypothetical protein